MSLILLSSTDPSAFTHTRIPSLLPSTAWCWIHGPGLLLLDVGHLRNRDWPGPSDYVGSWKMEFHLELTIPIIMFITARHEPLQSTKSFFAKAIVNWKVINGLCLQALSGLVVSPWERKLDKAIISKSPSTSKNMWFYSWMVEALIPKNLRLLSGRDTECEAPENLYSSTPLPLSCTEISPILDLSELNAQMLRSQVFISK